MRTIAYQSNNMEFNPLYEKMKNRFCAEGTIADQLRSRAGAAKKQKPQRHPMECDMAQANSLPKAKRTSAKRSFFTLRNINTACMLLLIAATILFSGVAIGSFHETRHAIDLSLYETTIEDSMILNDAMPWQSADSGTVCEELSFSL